MARPPARRASVALWPPLATAGLLASTLGCQPSASGGATEAHAESATGLVCVEDGGFSATDDRGTLKVVPRPGARATVIDVWAPWCIPCRTTVSRAVAQREALAAEGIDLVLLGEIPRGADRKPEDVGRAKLASWGIVGEPFLIDEGSQLMQRYGLFGEPAVVILDAEGNLRWTAVGKAATEKFAERAREAARTPCSP